MYMHVSIRMCTYTYRYAYIWRRKWQPTLVFLPGESCGQRSLSIGSHRMGHDWSDLACMHALEKEMQLTPVFLPGESQGQRSLLGCHLWGYTVRHDWSDLAAATAACINMGFPGGSDSKESSCNGGDLGSIPGFRRSAGEENSYPLQYSGLENSVECIIHRVTESDMTERLSYANI